MDDKTAIYDAIAILIADANLSDRATLRQALYAAALVVEVPDLTPAKAAELSSQYPWTGPANAVYHAIESRIQEWEKVRTMEETVDFWHITEDLREAVSELLIEGQRTDALNLIRDNSAYNLAQAVIIVNGITAQLGIAEANAVQNCGCGEGALPPF